METLKDLVKNTIEIRTSFCYTILKEVRNTAPVIKKQRGIHMSLEIFGQSIPNMPWQDRPEGCKDVIWRYNANPIIPLDLLPTSNSIFNSAVVPFESDKGHFAGVFRVDDKERNMAIHAGFSKDGIHWDINPEKVEWINDDPETAEALSLIHI